MKINGSKKKYEEIRLLKNLYKFYKSEIKGKKSMLKNEFAFILEKKNI